MSGQRKLMNGGAEKVSLGDTGISCLSADCTSQTITKGGGIRLLGEDVGTGPVVPSCHELLTV